MALYHVDSSAKSGNFEDRKNDYGKKLHINDFLSQYTRIIFRGRN